jgi:hypothetical protein
MGSLALLSSMRSVKTGWSASRSTGSAFHVSSDYVFDLWAKGWRRREATGDMSIVRYADDLKGIDLIGLSQWR